MSTLRKTIKGSFILSGGEALGYAASFARNIVLARVLTKADFGVAAVFAAAIALFDITSKMAVGSVIVQAKDGDKLEFLKTAHLVQFTTGLFSAGCVFVLAPWLAAMFHLPESINAFRALALLPLFKGLEHLDIWRRTRELNFFPQVVVEMIPQIVITLAAWPVAIWFPDYRVILILLACKSAMSCLMSHFLAKAPYKWNYHRNYTNVIVSFGWPLVLNGFLTFLIFQADRALVGAYYSLGDLGVYSAAALLTFVPTNLLGQINGNIVMPILARVQHDVPEFRRRAELYVKLVCIISVIYSVVLIIAGELLMVAAFGEKYIGGGLVLACLATVNGLRIFRFATTAVAFAKGDTKNSLISSSLRAAGVMATVVAVALSQPLWIVALSGAAGEILALWGSLHRLTVNCGLPMLRSLQPVLLSACGVGMSLTLVVIGIQRVSPLFTLVLALGCGGALSGLLIVLFADLRLQGFSFAQRGFRALRLRFERIA